MRHTFWIILASLAMSPAFTEITAQYAPPKPVEDPNCCWNPGYEVPCGCMSAGYNFPAQIYTQEWDAYISTSFLYWEAREDGLSLAIESNATPAAAPTSVINTVVYQDFEYKPGVKVEAGFISECWDDWGGLIEYTRLHGTYRNNNVPLFGGTLQTLTTDSFSSRWKNALDVIDFGLFRSYYVGRRLTLMTYFGGRGGWIDQSLNFDVIVQNPPAGINNPIHIQLKSDSWFVGPRAALRTNWLLGYGFSLVGNTSASICYQKFNTKSYQEDDTTPGLSTTTILKISQIRPYFDLQAGLRWGWYTCDRRFHFDLQATYDFMVYFNQNMIRTLIDLENIGNEGTPGNLYFDGLTLKAMFNF